MDHGAISLAAQERQQTPHVPVGQAQTPSCFGLFQTAFPHLLQHFQSLPLAHTQADSLLLHRVPRPLEKRTFLLCTIRTFSFCGDKTSETRVAESPE
jgi:hypothetical protein